MGYFLVQILPDIKSTEPIARVKTIWWLQNSGDTEFSMYFLKFRMYLIQIYMYMYKRKYPKVRGIKRNSVYTVPLFMNNFSPKRTLGSFQTFFKNLHRYSQVKLHHWSQQHQWQICHLYHWCRWYWQQICHRCQRYRDRRHWWQIATDINDTVDKFATGVNNTGGK